MLKEWIDMLVSVAPPALVRITSGRPIKQYTPDMLIIQSSFLEGPKAALVASKDFEDGHYREPPQLGIRAFARVYCAWAYGQTVRFFFFNSISSLSISISPVVSRA